MFFKSDREKTSGHFILWENIVTAPFIKGKNDWRFRDWFGALESGWLSESPVISKKRFAPTATCCSDSAFLLFWYPGKKTFPFPPSPSPKAKRTSSFTNSSKTNVFSPSYPRRPRVESCQIANRSGITRCPRYPRNVGIKISLSRSNRKKPSLLLRLSASSDGVKERESSEARKAAPPSGGRFFSFLPFPPLSWPLSLMVAN